MASTGLYTLKIDIKALSTFTAGTTYWTMRNNTSGNRMFLRKFLITSEFVGTAAATLSMFAFFRFSGATPTTGTVLNPVSFDSTAAASNLLDARFNAAGLTMAGVTVETDPLFITSTINQLVSSEVLNPVDIAPLDVEALVLNPGEGIAIQAFNLLVAGVGLHGVAQWTEGV
jgi:hypothetical protein